MTPDGVGGHFMCQGAIRAVPTTIIESISA